MKITGYIIMGLTNIGCLIMVISSISSGDSKAMLGILFGGWLAIVPTIIGLVLFIMSGWRATSLYWFIVPVLNILGSMLMMRG